MQKRTNSRGESRLGLVPPSRTGGRRTLQRRDPEAAETVDQKPDKSDGSDKSGTAEKLRPERKGKRDPKDSKDSKDSKDLKDLKDLKAAARTRALRTPKPPKPRFRLTRRATILVLALCAVVVTIAYPLQEYLAQSSQLDALDQQNAGLSTQVSQLQRQIALWNDPGYLQIQARAQLHYVKPGEEGFTVPGPANGSEQLGLPTPTPSPWYDQLWNSVKSPAGDGTTAGG